MASSLKNLSKIENGQLPDGNEMTFGIVVSDWNSDITHALLEGALETLAQQNVKEENIHVIHVPGSFELTVGASMLANKYEVNAVICLGCVITGETKHNEYINQAVATGLTQLGIVRGKPFIFGVLTPDDKQQALDRAGGKHGNKGVEAAATALRMAHIKQSLSATKKKIGF